MIKKINQIIRQFKETVHNDALKRFESRRGQIAVILMLVIAAALIFYAVSLNVGKLSHTKTMTTMASNAGASKLASQMASYGQVLFMETLGGKKRVCGLTGIAAAIVSIVVTVICIIIIAASYSSGTPAAAALWMACIGLALSIVSLIVQITYVQPGITEMWNKIIAETMEMSDQFVENGIQTGLTGIISDSKRIPDLDDLDADTVFGFEDSDGDGQYETIDEYSRYAFYYTERLKQIEIMSASIMIEFQEALRDFVYEDVNTDWGIYDPPDCGVNCCYFGPGVQVNSYCNPCCLPVDMVDPTDTSGTPPTLIIRPTCCDSGAAQCGEVATCGVQARSPFLNGPEQYPWVFDDHTENYENTFQSFMEKLGWDDEHTDYRKDMTGMIPPAATTVVNPDYIDGLPQAVDPLGDYRIEDAIGFMGMDGKPGIFSYFWKLMEWGTDLNNAALPAGCQWCDEDMGGAGVNTCPADYAPMWEQTQIVLPVEPGDPEAPQFDPTFCVDPLTANQVGTFSNGLGHTFAYPPVAPDNLDVPQNILADDTECAQEIFSYDGSGLAVENELVGFWKPGIERYCNRTTSADPRDYVDPVSGATIADNPQTWPYYGNCPGRGTYTDPDYGYAIDCVCEDYLDGTCSGGSIANYHEDVLDDLVYGLPEFTDWADVILDYTPRRLVRDFAGWYPDAADWIEPPSPPATTATDPPCYICGTAAEPHVGMLWVWRGEMNAISERVTRWLENDAADNFNYRGDSPFTDGSGNDVWCIPNNTANIGQPAANCISAQEVAAIEGIGYNPNSLMAALGCFTWNATDDWGGTLPSAVALPAAPTPTPTETTVGNWAKFNACSDPGWCMGHQDLCRDVLPRSLVPDFCTDHESVFRNSDDATALELSQCLSTLDNTFPPTSDASHNTAEPSDGAVNQPPFDGPDDTVDGGWICGTTDSNLCGEDLSRDVTYLANHDCEIECGQIAGLGGQYVEAGIDWDAPTYSTVNHTITCNWVEEDVPVNHPQMCYDAVCFIPAVSCSSTPAVPAGICGGGDCSGCAEAGCSDNAGTCEDGDGDACSATPAIPAGTCGGGDCSGCQEAGCADDGGTCLVNQAPSGSCMHDCSYITLEDIPRTKSCDYYTEVVDDPGDCVTTDADAFETQVSRAHVLSGGSCAETVDNEFCRGCFFDSATYGSPVPRAQKRIVGYITAMEEARDESVNQMEKLEYRQSYINDRVGEMQEVQTLMDEAVSEFDAFLTGAAADLIQARIDYDNAEDKGLPYHAVYGWQDDPPEDAEPGRVGQWHVVRVDARSPGRCDNSCSTDYSQSGNWPRVKTYSKSWGMERCYELTDTDGRVKFRVTRYDEPIFYGSGGGGTSETRNRSEIFFPGGRKLWDFRADLPLGDTDRPPPSANNLGLTCQDSMPDDPPGLPPPYNAGGEKSGIYKGAFLLNSPHDNTNCWARAARLLTHGVSTETCAEYYFHEGLVPGFSVRFVACPDTPFQTIYRSP